MLLGTDLSDTLGRKREIPVGRPLLATSRRTGIGGYAWHVADLYERFRSVILNTHTSINNHLYAHMEKSSIDKYKG